MSYTKYNQLKINGQNFEGSKLADYCHVKLKESLTKDWEVQVFDFILKWLDESDEIRLKTSGSTGKAKSILLKKEHMINSAKMTQNALELAADQHALLALSAHYIAGKMMIVRSFVSKLNLSIVEPSGNPIKKIYTPIDFIALVPYQLAQILKSKPEIKKLKKIKTVLIGGGSTDHSLINSIKDFPNDFYASYGMTETCTHIALQKLNGPSADKYFNTLPNINISIDQRSCLQINAPHLSEESIQTNDIVNIISASEFEIKGRFDNVINSGGIKIFPEEIEAKLNGKFTDGFIISSIPHPELGEQLILIFDSDKADLASLFNSWKEIELALSDHEIPKQIEFLSPFSYVGNGKIDRLKMRKRIREKLKNA